MLVKIRNKVIDTKQIVSVSDPKPPHPNSCIYKNWRICIDMIGRYVMTVECPQGEQEAISIRHQLLARWVGAKGTIPCNLNIPEIK
jgi:hypothetical protein